MKKTVKNIAGGVETTATGPDGSKTITYEGVNNLQIGRTYNISTSAYTTSHANTWNLPSSSRPHVASMVKTGVTFKKVDSLQLNSKEINKMLSSHDHKTYATSEEYLKSTQTSDNHSSESNKSSFKR